STFSSSLALSILTNKNCKLTPRRLTRHELDVYFSKYDIKRLEMYSNNLVDYHLVVDLMPSLARIYFMNQMDDVHMSAVQSAILLGIGLQHKIVDTLSTELDLPSSQLLGLFNRLMRRSVQYLNSILEEEVERTWTSPKDVVMTPVVKDMNKELEEAAQELQKKQKKELEKLKKENLEKFAIKGSEEEWSKALNTKGKKSLVSVK
ncbi:hypothetical protein Trydic_g599, partial [Trypoxylus dichotomus]